MIENVIRLKNKKVTNNARIVALTNKNVDISDKMVWDGKILNNYDVIIINNIELLSKNQTIKWLNTAKKLKNDCKINTGMFTHLISNKEDINYYKSRQNSQYIKEIADKVWILKKDDDNDNNILFKIEKSNFEELDDCWYYMYKMENGKLKKCLWEKVS